MHGDRWIFLCFGLCTIVWSCTKDKNNIPPVIPGADTSLVNESHLDHLYVPVVFQDGTQAAGVYIYSQYPTYDPVEAGGEGYTCVDDVSRAAIFFARCPDLLSDTAKQSKLLNLVRFVVKMQSQSGYFYNFLQMPSGINVYGPTSAAGPNWWSWRAFQCLTEVRPVIFKLDAGFASTIDQAIEKLLTVVKQDFFNLAETTTSLNGINMPTWLPAGSATDQAATLLLGLINYAGYHADTQVDSLIRKFSNGVVLMQQGDSLKYPFSMILSWQNTWHSYGGDQPYALLSAGTYLHNAAYLIAGYKMIDDFYPWLLTTQFKSSIVVTRSDTIVNQVSANNYEQIAYGYRPMIFASIKAFQLTGDKKYADLAGKLSTWFLGANDASAKMYNTATGVCFDAISAGNSVNQNSGAESTIEALLSFQAVEANPIIKGTVKSYRN